MFNLDKIDLKKEIKTIKENNPGKERGADIKFLSSYVSFKEGEKGFEKVKKELGKLGYKLPDIKKIGDTEWIPSSLPAIFMLASAKYFHWKKEDLIDLGKSSLSFSKTMKIFIKYFLSPEKTFREAARSWRKYYSFGLINIVEYNKKKKTIKVRLRDFKRHPIICVYFQGVFSEIVKVATGSPKITVKETKCMFKGDPYHEFIIKWQ